MELQGEIQTQTVFAWSSQNNVSVDVAKGVFGTVVGSLLPNTDYTITVTLTIFGGAYISSLPVVVRTKDGGRSTQLVDQLY